MKKIKKIYVIVFLSVIAVALIVFLAISIVTTDTTVVVIDEPAVVEDTCKNKKPIPNFSLPSNPEVNQEVTFDDNSGNSPTAWKWNIQMEGQNIKTVREEKSFNHTFSQPGSYTVELTVSNSCGDSSLKQNITILKEEGLVLPPPQEFSISKVNINIPQYLTIFIDAKPSTTNYQITNIELEKLLYNDTVKIPNQIIEKAKITKNEDGSWKVEKPSIAGYSRKKIDFILKAKISYQNSKYEKTIKKSISDCTLP